ncbi:MAG: host-nuclease inhibitor Gam family protein [Bacteroidia bacterium]|nr:host-nuclease inhibitor Gam family protein [Bacteroidia bacterium]
MAKAKPDSAAIHSRAKDLMSNLKDLTIKRDTIQAKCDAKIKPVQNEFDKQIAPIAEQIATKEKALEDLVTEHRALLFTTDAKSLELPFGTFGFKDSPPSLQYLEDHSEETVIGLIKKFAKKFIPTWIKSKETLVKNAVKKAVDDGTFKEAGLEKLGLKIEAAEKFFYKIGKQKL